MKVKNLFQVSTLKAIAVVLSTVGVSIPEPVIQTISWSAIGLWGLYESFRDEKKGENKQND